MNKDNKLSIETLRIIILICKEANQHYLFLSYFEQDLVKDTIYRYSRYGKEMRLSENQVKILLEIRDKLFMGIIWEESELNNYVNMQINID